MSVIANNLMPSEEIQQSALITPDSIKYQTLGIAGALILCYLSQVEFFTILSVLVAIPAMIYVVLCYLNYAGKELALTNQRAISKHGFFSHQIDSMVWNKVESVSVFQSFLGRKLNYGTINIYGVSGETVSSRYVTNPSDFRKDAIKLIEQK